MDKVASHPSSKSAVSARIVKAVGLFSGLQIVSILCSVIKTKLVSIWLGSVGIGIFGILTSAQETIATFTDLGLRQSTVRDVAANAKSDSKLARITAVIRRWSVLAGLLGASVMLALSPALGQWFFGSAKGFYGFAIVAAAMFLNCLLYGEQSLLQGTGRLRLLARSSLIGTIIGLAISIPLFRLLGLISIPLSFVIYSLSILAATLYYRYRPPQKAVTPGLRQLWLEGSGFVKLGILMSIAAFLTSLSRLVFIACLTHLSSLDTVGLFQAGDTIVTRYIGLIFTAIGMEYFPRLVTVIKSSHRTSLFVNHETVLLTLIVTPVVLLFILCRDIAVNILYSESFTPILTFISLAVAGSIMKAASWSLSFCMIARGDGRTYLLAEGLDALLSLALLLIGYQIWGLTGIGWAYIAWNLLYTLLVAALCRRRYSLKLSRQTIATIAVSVAAALGACAVMRLSAIWLQIVIILSCALAYIVPLRNLIRRKKRTTF